MNSEFLLLFQFFTIIPYGRILILKIGSYQRRKTLKRWLALKNVIQVAILLMLGINCTNYLKYLRYLAAQDKISYLFGLIVFE